MTVENTQTLLAREDVQIIETTQIGKFQIVICEYKRDEVHREVENMRMWHQFKNIRSGV